MWIDATTQAIYSTGITIWTTFGSYNGVGKSIVGDAVIMVAYDAIFSFFAGAAIFSVVGYLREQEFPMNDDSGLELVLIALPAAISETTARPKLYTFMFFACIFIFAMDSIIGWVETVVTILYDFPACRVIRRPYFVFFICVISALSASMYTSNTGYTHQNAASGDPVFYLIVFLAFFFSIGATWRYKYMKTCEKYSRFETRMLIACYWIPVVGTSFIHVIDSKQMILVGGAFFLYWALFIVGFKFYMDWTRRNRENEKTSWSVYLTDFVLYGSMHIFGGLIGLSASAYYLTVLKYWWSFSLKFFMPWVLVQLFCIFFIDEIGLNSAHDDTLGDEASGERVMKWEIVKILYLAPFFLIIAYYFFTSKDSNDFDLASLYLEKVN